MSNKIENAVAHLNKILPLRERQKTLNTETAEIYQLILRSFVDTGKSLRKSEMMAKTDNIDEVINTLKRNDMVVFDSENEIIGAYPFTMEKRAHKIQVNGHRLHAMCALDALAISPMFNIETHIDSICEISGEAISIDQLNRKILNTDLNASINEDLYFGINWNAAENNCCATSLCTEMIFLKDSATAESWRSQDTQQREVFTLDEAVDFSAQFFTPLLHEHK